MEMAGAGEGTKGDGHGVVLEHKRHILEMRELLTELDEGLYDRVSPDVNEALRAVGAAVCTLRDVLTWAESVAACEEE